MVGATEGPLGASVMSRPRSDGRWLVVGDTGLLGTDLMATLASREVTGVARPEIDITDLTSVEDAVADFDVVINCAAWTAVDDAETHEAEAFSVNALGAANLARACALTGAWLAQLSTDYVFDGGAATPYPEDAPIAPRSAYGRTKAAGEWAVRAELPDRSWVVRTAWLYGEHGPNFVSTMRRLEAERDTLDVVDDQWGQPTWSRDLAERIVALVDRAVPAGNYHATASGATTWFGLAQCVFELIGADPARISRATTAQFPRPAARPGYSVLGHESWGPAGLAPMRHWSDALTAAWPRLLIDP